MTHHPTQSPQFFLTAPSPCPYVDGQFERKVFTHLVGDKAREMNDLLTQGGFRRSQNIAYRPACESCRSCVSVRILAGEFSPSKNMRRVIARNADLIGAISDAEPSTEQYSLFRSYLDARHRKGGMSEMTVLDYAMMVEDTHVQTKIIEYRRRGPDSFITGRGEGELIAVALSDKMADGLSMVYSYYNPELEDRSLGTYMILDHIARARAEGLPHVYLGYWVNGSRKMNYKVRFTPQEHLGPRGWERYKNEAV
ncbi:arginyltransferase [Kumtagia ephedrae]|jgi:arginine-tRNA-protein transferase|uniref:Aspartate/glutamate leucyltransferase n=1 Tax=Kumtagia ephedrae TaxID=2116701 RepID=A0A2P7STI0_9HYPH|nr:arginyltransferase [Mesorhizobium ephedrae]PSJ65751.1 arginyltransferase [Mesorhizobium ephedrae]